MISLQISAVSLGRDSKFLDTLLISRRFRAPMNHQATIYWKRQRSALKVFAGTLVAPCGAHPHALEIGMR